MKFFDIFKQNWRPKGHFCSTYVGTSYFWKYLKDPSCGVDPQTGVAICEECGTILKPPFWLEKYQFFSYRGYSFIIMLLFLSLHKMFHWKPTTTIPCAALVIFVVSYLTPALLASLGTWTEIHLNGETLDAFLDQQRLKQLKQLDKPFYRWAYNIAILLMSILLALVIIS